MRSSGTTAIATTTDSAVVAITPNDDHVEDHCQIINEGEAPGFMSFDGGTSWARMPGEYQHTFDDLNGRSGVQVKRVAGGTDLSDVFVFMW